MLIYNNYYPLSLVVGLMLCKLNKLLTSLSLVFRNFDCEPIFNELKSYTDINQSAHRIIYQQVSVPSLNSNN